MISSSQLLKDLQKQVTLLEVDLRRRCDAEAQVNAPLQAQYEGARESKRTAETLNTWREEQIAQIAVAWVLACVFVRFLEDNQLLEAPFIAGPDAARMNRARDEQELFFREHATASERDYLLHVFGAVGQLPGMREFFDRRHNPLWVAGPTGDALAGLLDFWRRTNPDTGALTHDFTDPDWNTRFLGDLYQDLSEVARKRYALLQTPEFVEQFILDRTLTPAIDSFGYRVVRMLDLTCGSGHFLLGGFDRLFRLWQEHEPGENPRVLAQRALDQVCGVDLNPNVVAIARFRLLLAALKACQSTPEGPPLKLKGAPDFKIHLAVGDSLLHGARFLGVDSHEGIQQTFGGDEIFRDELQHFYETEDRAALHEILGRQYHVVVGNPPYVGVRDKGLNQLYRDRFDSCHGIYTLAVPFMERFFDLAIEGRPRDTQQAGNVGMITSNSFIKAEFGKKLIEEFIPRWDLTHVIDTAGAYIPGHGTPTVILFGKHQPPIARTIRTVMGIRGEPDKPTDPPHGLVWTAILSQVDQPGSQSDFVSVADTPRVKFHKHPWSIGGGGAADLKEQLETAKQGRLEDLVNVIGRSTHTGEDDAFFFESNSAVTHGLAQFCICSVGGENIRDFMLNGTTVTVFPYDQKTGGRFAALPSPLSRHFWPLRTLLKKRRDFGEFIEDRGLSWWEHSMFFPDRYRSQLSIAMGFVATHNHFVLDRGGKVFNRTAPVIKLHSGSSEVDHFALLGLLNSSTVCFWLKQVCFPKGGDQQGGEGARVRTTLWDVFYNFNSTPIARLPIPDEKPLALARELDRLAQQLKAHTPGAVVPHAACRASALRDALATARQQWTDILQRMIALQEELDWECYRIYEVASDEWRVTSGPEALNAGIVPLLRLGERAFEIVMARKMARGELHTSWFERHNSTPITELPAHWPAAYRALVERRIALIERDRNIALIEQPEYKRRWNVEPWDEQQEWALQQWLLNRLEGYFFEGERMSVAASLQNAALPPPESGEGSTTGLPTAAVAARLAALRASWPAGQKPGLVSTNQLAELVQADAAFLEVAEVYAGAAGFSVPKLVRELVESESVPFLPFQRYKESGLRKRQDWERTWDLQRREDEFDARIEPLMKELEDLAKESGKDADCPEAPKWKARKGELGELIRGLKDGKAREVSVIPVPPKYASADFRSSTFWRLRGKLDVPKERWVSYPGAEREADPSPVIAWAGWNHLYQAQALAEYYLTAKDTWGWSPERLHLLLAGLADFLPWLKQWHNEPDPEHGMLRLGDYFAGFLDEECRKNGTTVQALEGRRFGA